MNNAEGSVVETGVLAGERRRMITYAALLVCLISLIGLRAKWLPLLYSFLDVSEPPHQADFIVMLGGYNEFRLPVILNLYEQNYARQILISGCDSEAYEAALLLYDAGVPSHAILLNDQGCDSTWEEARKVLAILQGESAGSALVVTNAWHTRRSRATYRRLNTDREIELTFVATTDEPFPTHNWWQDTLGQIIVRNEYLKLAYYLVKYRVIPI
jgi:uncharacterized SAM-binding protein YcdF (DUF218 family)